MTHQPSRTRFANLALTTVVAAFVLLAPFASVHASKKQIANDYFTPTVTADALRAQFNREQAGLTTQPIRVLVVPGHEPNAGGAEYKTFKERDWNVILARQLMAYFNLDPRFDAVLARDGEVWNEDFEKFYKRNEDEIEDFIDDHKEVTADFLEGGELYFADAVKHGNAPARVAQLLYGLNLWANTQDFDIVINIHFNDTGGRNIARQYPAGFAIYVPDTQYSNGEASFAIGTSIKERLEKYHAISDLPQEETGVTVDEKLIALGSYNTLDPASVLIEYGYIYEYRFADTSIRTALIADYALQTYLGLHDFFLSDQEVYLHDSLLALLTQYGELPLRKSKNKDLAVLGLQAQLIEQQFYPAPGDTLRNCPLDGIFGNCTERAVKAFQDEHNLGVDGIVGPATYSKLGS